TSCAKVESRPVGTRRGTVFELHHLARLPRLRPRLAHRWEDLPLLCESCCAHQTQRLLRPHTRLAANHGVLSEVPPSSLWHGTCPLSLCCSVSRTGLSKCRDKGGLPWREKSSSESNKGKSRAGNSFFRITRCAPSAAAATVPCSSLAEIFPGGTAC